MTVGKVYLIGAGPGAADLISLRGYRALRSADALLIDRLLPEKILAELGISTLDKDVEWLADKTPHWSQNKINTWLTTQAYQGKNVARLKGGDPFLFGQAEEETGHLSKLGIPWEVIPGASSFTSVLTAAGFPLTRRHQGRSFAVATARTAGGAVSDSFPKSDSLVIMMGVRALDQIVTQLLADGWPTDTQAAIVERGTMTWERRVLSRLDRLAVAAKNAKIASPACVIVGNAATPILNSQERPTILFTGLDPSNFRTLGNLIHWPALELAANLEAQNTLPDLLFSLKHREFQWIIFAGKVGVTSLFEELDKHKLDSRILAGANLATIGVGTADRLREHGVRPEVLAENKDPQQVLRALDEFSGFGGIDGLGELDELSKLDEPGNQSVLVVEGTHGPRRLYERLMEYDVTVRTLALNRVIPNRELGQAALPAHDVIFFVSPSGVRAYYDAYGAAAFQSQVWCLGEDTRCELLDYGTEARVLMADEFARPKDLLSLI